MNQKPVGRALSSEQIIREIKRKTRKHYSAEEKIRIVLDGLRGEDSIAELCRRRIEAQPQQPGVAEDNHQGMAPAPGKRECPEVHLALVACRRLEPHGGRDRLARTHRAHVVPHALVAARVARRADLIEQPFRGQLRKRLETRVDDPLVGIQFVGHWRTRCIYSRTGRQIPVQLARLDPRVNCRSFDLI